MYIHVNSVGQSSLQLTCLNVSKADKFTSEYMSDIIIETNLGTTKCVLRAKFAVNPNLDDIALLHLLKFTIVAPEATHLLTVNI